MPNNALIFFSRPKPTKIVRLIGNSNAPLILDVTKKEVYTARVEATKHPVENGADITDHAVSKPATLQLSGVITQTPLGNFAAEIAATAGATVASKVGATLGKFGSSVGTAGAAIGAVAGGAISKSIATSLFGGGDRDLGAIASEFKNTLDDKQALTIITGLQSYVEFILTSFSVTRDQKTGGSINVDLEFEELIFAESQTTRVAIPKVPGGLNGSNLGKQSTESLNSDQAGRGSSILKKIIGGA